MDQNMRAQDLPERSHPEPMDYDFSHELSQPLYQPITAPELPVGESSQDVMHVDESNFGYPQYTSEEPPASFYFQLPIKNQNLWEEFQSPPAAMEQINTLPAAACFTTLQLQLPVNVGEFSKGMLHNEGYNCGYTSQPFSSPLMEVVQGVTTSSSRQTRRETGNYNPLMEVVQGATTSSSRQTRHEMGNYNPLMEVVQGATTSSSRQTRRETGNSSHKTYAYWSEEDVKQLIIAVREHGVRRKSWGKIVQSPYFKDKGRKKEHLMYKWIHMMKVDLSKCPDDMRELYIWARKVEAELQ